MIKSTSQPIESTSFEEDADLQFEAAPDSSYELRGIIFVTFHSTSSPRAGLQMRIDGPAGSEIRWGTNFSDDDTEPVLIGGAVTTMPSETGAVYRAVISGTVQTNANGGTVALSYRKSITTPDNIDVESGSFLVAGLLA